jgi:predicted secreted protein
MLEDLDTSLSSGYATIKSTVGRYKIENGLKRDVIMWGKSQQPIEICTETSRGKIQTYLNLGGVARMDVEGGNNEDAIKATVQSIVESNKKINDKFTDIQIETLKILPTKDATLRPKNYVVVTGQLKVSPQSFTGRL